MEMENTLEVGEGPPLQERWPPLGASASPDLPIMAEPRSLQEDRVQELIDEKEQLSSSLFSLTTRFAQIQFRLHQITEASPEDKDELLKELEEFAHRGCVDQHAVLNKTTNSDDEKAEMTEDLKEKHDVIISELKSQLDDLESYAFKQGAGKVPQSLQLEKQQALIEQLTRKLNLRVDDEDIAHASVDDLKSRVDDAVAEIVNPAKMKEKLVDHLQTQIQDLERFVEFLQAEVEVDGHKSSGSVPNPNFSDSHKRKDRKQTLALVKRVLAVVHMFSLAQLGCGAHMSPPEDTHVSDPKSMIAELKTAVNHIRTVAARQMRTCDGESETDTTSCSDSDDNEAEELNQPPVPDEMTEIVRKELCTALFHILGDGLVHDAVGRRGTALIAPISCILPRKFNSTYAAESMHPWELFLEYYEIKNGSELAKAPSRMLTRAFNLEDLVAAGDEKRSRSARYSLLEAIHLVVNDHNPLKRSFDDMFKALVCLGLNAGRLSRWIRLVARSPALVSHHYSDASYVARTGMEGVVTVLSRLDPLVFHLPVDVAVRPFKNIKDAF
uniref:RUN domain-containing protein 1-like n=1 Tax=Phallusia mammillata TaxID=59560 RepID=A0A6F9DRM6_9ASCI|nr:RUN domain-containing protein 1-like [Phallusia mammillata]